jgi:deoxycytidine triphosphate deaminase
MILSNEEIRQALASGAIEIVPRPDADQYTTSAVDLFLGNQFQVWDDKLFKARGARIDLNLAEQQFAQTAAAFLVDKQREIDGSILLPSGSFVLAITRERVKLRHDARIAARVEGRSSLARIGLVVHLTAPTIHAGFDGYITLEMVNHGPFVLRLVPDRTRICQLIFERLGQTPSGSIATEFQGQEEPSGRRGGQSRSSSGKTEAAPFFARYIGIDYSGAETPTASLKGLRVYEANGTSSPLEILPPSGPKKYWTRRGVAEWLATRLAEDVPTLVGIDHGFSFPLRYFERHGLARDWQAFLEDFRLHWPTDEDGVYVDFVREGDVGNGAARTGETRWRRLTELRAGAAKSVFLFDVQGSVAKSTHSGLPWLLYLRRQLGARVHFWPFDGWEIPDGRSVVAEVYPSLWSRNHPPEGRTADQHDAHSIVVWMQRTDREGGLDEYFAPTLTADELAVACCEGWILGVK